MSSETDTENSTKWHKTDESLSSKKHNAIVEGLKYGYFFPKDVREAIQKLKEEKVDYTTSRKRWLNNILNKHFGDDLTHSPSEPVKDTPDDTLGQATQSKVPSGNHSQQVGKTAGNHAQTCAKCGRLEMYHVKGIPCKKFTPNPSSDKIDCANCDNPNENCIHKEFKLPIIYRHPARFPDKRDKQPEDAICTKTSGCDNQDCTNKGKKE